MRTQSSSKLTENAGDLIADLWAEGSGDALHSTRSSKERWDTWFIRNPLIAYVCSLSLNNTRLMVNIGNSSREFPLSETCTHLQLASKRALPQSSTTTSFSVRSNHGRTAQHPERADVCSQSGLSPLCKHHQEMSIWDICCKEKIRCFCFFAAWISMRSLPCELLEWLFHMEHMTQTRT